MSFYLPFFIAIEFIFRGYLLLGAACQDVEVNDSASPTVLFWSVMRC